MVDATREECDRYAKEGSVHRAFVILKDRDTIPEGKGPFLTQDHLDRFIREAIAGRPADTQIIAVLGSSLAT